MEAMCVVMNDAPALVTPLTPTPRTHLPTVLQVQLLAELQQGFLLGG